MPSTMGYRSGGAKVKPLPHDALQPLRWEKQHLVHTACQVILRLQSIVLQQLKTRLRIPRITGLEKVEALKVTRLKEQCQAQ